MPSDWLRTCECCHVVETTVLSRGRPRCSMCRALCPYDMRVCALDQLVQQGTPGVTVLADLLEADAEETRPGEPRQRLRLPHSRRGRHLGLRQLQLQGLA